MKNIAFLIVLLTMSSCFSGFYKSRECKRYYRFVKENWTQPNDSLYLLKGSPNYWESKVYFTYFKEECLVGLTKKQIEKIFGMPSKSFKDARIDVYVYCMIKECLRGEIDGCCRSLSFLFDENEKVMRVHTNPPEQATED
jgi:hypothetical protein